MNTNFSFETELVRHLVAVHDGTGRVLVAPSRDKALEMVRQYLEIGVMSRAITEHGFYVKWAWDMDQDGNWMYSYDLVWREVN